MPDLRNIRSRPGVRIQLHPADIADVMQQQDVVQSFNDQELLLIIETLQAEVVYRQNERKENDCTAREK